VMIKNASEFSSTRVRLKNTDFKLFPCILDTGQVQFGSLVRRRDFFIIVNFTSSGNNGKW
jgi:hypothetical protein